ncbi:MAG: heat-inducible transcription repressor HrcA [Acidobacteriales bacterium]|nr:heat-inducible transcription repressor HrcA [Terriglobales bacterium]
MTTPLQIGPRGREILTAIVRTYIESGEPVGSRTISRITRDGLSPATIRNVMADLTDAGMLEQPHTSAGRVPTPKAYRYFVDHLSGRGELTPASQELITDSLSGVNDPQEFLERTSRVLSLISNGVGVSIAQAPQGKSSLEHIYFSRLASQKVLAVVVTKAGIVRDRVLRLQRDIQQSDLDAAARYINECFQGWTIESLRIELARRLEQERSEYDTLMRSVEDLYRGGALQGTPPAVSGVFVEGMGNLLASEQDRARLRELLGVLEERQRVVELLSAYVDTQQEAVRVVVGLEDTMPEMHNFVLIGAPARMGTEVMGSLAVIGPTRIDYERTMIAVRYIAGLFDKILND